MFYENLYEVLGKLFYHVAAVEGKVHAAERDKLHQVVQNNWQSLEDSADEYGTDQSSLIEFAFDFEEAESVSPTGLEDFEFFYKQYKHEFTPDIKDKILRTIHAINVAYHGENKREEKLFYRVKKLFDQA